jgi:hypothetical protein
MGLEMLIKALGLPEGSTVDDVIAALGIAEGATAGDMLAATIAALDSLPAAEPAGGPPAPTPVPAPAPAPVAAATVNEEKMAARIAASVMAHIEVDQAGNLTPLERSLLLRATAAERKAFIATKKVKANVLPGGASSQGEANGDTPESIAAVAKAIGRSLSYVKGAK